MLDDLDKTLENVLRHRGGLGADIDIAFDQPNREWASRLSRPTLNMFSFDLRENQKLRQLERDVTKMNGHSSKITIPPRRVDVSYLVTSWTRKIEDEHRLLWRALSTLKRVNYLDPAACEGALRYSQVDIPLLVAETSPTMTTNLVDLWSVLDNQLHLGFTVVVTLELDLAFEEETPLVLEATVRTAQSDRPQARTVTARSEDIKIPGRKKRVEEGDTEN
jgi:hypothetical protein